jgi:hypothetical protein
VLFPSPRNPALDPAAPSADWQGLSKPWRQIATIVAMATIAAWLSPYWMRGTGNASLWLGASIGVASLANKGAGRLLFAPVLALIFLVALFGNEVAAHLVFGTCLQD